MIKLYYTTSSQQYFGNETAQDKAKNSIGGFKSSSAVVNDFLGNLFGDVSIMAASNEQLISQYAMIVAVNESSETITNVKTWVEYLNKEDCQCILRLSAVDSYSDGSFERIPTKLSKPMYAEFREAEIDNKIDLGDMSAGEKVGIWINRELLTSKIKQQYEDIVEEDAEHEPMVKEKQSNKFDSITLKFSWD